MAYQFCGILEQFDERLNLVVGERVELLHPRIVQDTFDLFQKKRRYKKNVAAGSDLQKKLSGRATRLCRSANENARVSGYPHLRMTPNALHGFVDGGVDFLFGHVSHPLR